MTDQSLSKIKKYLFWGSAILLLAYLLYVLADIFIILVLSILLSIIFEPFIKLIEDKGLTRLTATILVFIVSSFLIYLIFSYIIPQLSYQVNQLIEILKDFSIHDQIVSIEKEIHKYLPFFKVGSLSKNV